MNRSVVARASTFLCLFALPIAACAGEQGDDVVVSEEAELRRLLPSEIVGSIAYGETKDVAYAAEPRYRALSFAAAEGDEIDARFVGAKGLDPVGLLLGAEFETLAQNDDESSTSRASHFTYRIPKTGTYYLAVREANEEGGQIAISLGTIDSPPPAPPPPPPPPPSDVFAPQSCTGDVLTQARAIKYFPKGSASGSRTISAAPGRAYLRARACSEFSGCGDWEESEVTTTSLGAKLWATSGAKANLLPGIVELGLDDRANDPVSVHLTVATGRISTTAVAHRLSLTPYSGPKAVSVTSYEGYTPNTNTETWQEPSYPAYGGLFGWVAVPSAQTGLTAQSLTNLPWDAVINETCAQARFSTVKVSAGQQQRVEMQGVIHWDLAPPANP